MKVLILSFSSNRVNEKSLYPNQLGMTFACVQECENELKENGHQVDHICINKKRIERCRVCGERGWGHCLKGHSCVMNDDFNEVHEAMFDYDAYVFVTPVYFWEMAETAKTFFDRLKRCDAFNRESKIMNKKIVCIACAGGSGTGTEEALRSFDLLNHFLKTVMHARIPVNKEMYETQRKVIRDAMKTL
ncbi:MAG: flavodoxin family protein [Erysipelotrichaceae bacterium]|nr:flavodoxin family protein [Erysipelotrichaceae bacterium]